MYKRDNFYVDSEYGYFIIFGNKVFNVEDVKDIYLRDEAMYVEMIDGSREYFDIVVNMCNIPLLLDFIREFNVAKKVNSSKDVCAYERSFRSFAIYMLLVMSIMLNLVLILVR